MSRVEASRVKQSYNIINICLVISQGTFPENFIKIGPVEQQILDLHTKLQIYAGGTEGRSERGREKSMYRADPWGQLKNKESNKNHNLLRLIFSIAKLVFVNMTNSIQSQKMDFLGQNLT